MIGDHLAVVPQQSVSLPCSKSEDIGYYTPDKQGDNCLQLPWRDLYPWVSRGEGAGGAMAPPVVILLTDTDTDISVSVSLYRYWLEKS